ncbi:MAG TPA: HD domain-containing protein [Pyrinomonadaceae bacterium]
MSPKNPSIKEHTTAPKAKPIEVQPGLHPTAEINSREDTTAEQQLELRTTPTKMQGRPAANSKPDKQSPSYSPDEYFSDLFEDRFEFIDDVHGQIYLNMLERDVVDSREFQRLFRLSQLGFVDLVYPTANHTRGVHSIGACHLSKRLVERLNDNNYALARKGFAGSQNVPEISQVEKVLISLGGLLHDISHGPFSHDIEKKTHHVFFDEETKKKPLKVRSHYGPYEKHDSYPANPSLYVTLMDTKNSQLARILKRHSPDFYQLLLKTADETPHIKSFTETLARSTWPNVEQEILPNLLFHLLVYEKPEEAEQAPLAFLTSFDETSARALGIGPDKSMWGELHRAWYQPFRHDIIGDTLSADLIDYLMRDQSRLGMKGGVDDKLLNFYVLVSWKPSPKADKGFHAERFWYRSAIDLSDHKRGTFRAERLNDLFRLLDLRHQIHEKAVYHRVVQSAIAMLSRACLILDRNKPSLKVLYGYAAESPALAGDDHFLEQLITASLDEETKSKRRAGNKAEAHRTLVHKLAERRVYRPLMVVPGDRVPSLLRLRREDNRENLEPVLRQLAAIIDSTFFSKFFLLTSKLIESLLQHALDSEDDIYEQVERLEKDDTILRKACEGIPKRVIFLDHTL